MIRSMRHLQRDFVRRIEGAFCAGTREALTRRPPYRGPTSKFSDGVMVPLVGERSILARELQHGIATPEAPESADRERQAQRDEAKLEASRNMP